MVSSTVMTVSHEKVSLSFVMTVFWGQSWLLPLRCRLLRGNSGNSSPISTHQSYCAVPVISTTRLLSAAMVLDTPGTWAGRRLSGHLVLRCFTSSLLADVAYASQRRSAATLRRASLPVPFIPAAFVPFMSLHYILVILTFQTFSLLLYPLW